MTNVRAKKLSEPQPSRTRTEINKWHRF